VTIKGFVGSVEKDLHNENIEKAKKDLQRIANAADKMQDTLSDLLKLSRIGHVVHPAEEINLNELTKEVLQDMAGLIQAGKITVKVSDKLPTVTVDRARLREVFENLINNAIKYMSNQKNPLIEIGLRSEGDEQILFIKDNGIGIAPQYQSKVFGLFEKLNPSSEGTGVGLTLIKRIIEIQGGRIWVESQGLGNGSTFCFTIPEGIKKGH
jgi:signal transduction histidine kinase